MDERKRLRNIKLITVGKDWKNTIKNVESETSMLIHSDHYSLIADIFVNLKRRKLQTTEERVKFDLPTPHQKLDFRLKIKEKLQNETLENTGEIAKKLLWWRRLANRAGKKLCLGSTRRYHFRLLAYIPGCIFLALYSWAYIPGFTFL